MRIVLWGALIAILYTYLGYPVAVDCGLAGTRTMETEPSSDRQHHHGSA